MSARAFSTKSGTAGRFDTCETIGQLHRQLATDRARRIPLISRNVRPMRLCASPCAILLIVEEQAERIAGRVELRLEPAGIEQQRVQLLALARLGEVMRETAIEVAARPLVLGRAAARLEDRDQRLVLRDEPFLSGPVAQEVAHGVVQPEEALFEIAFEQQRQIEQLSQQVVGLEILKSARRGPQARDDANRNVRVLGKDSKLAETLAFGLGQKVEADADRERDRVGALCLVARIEGDEALRVEPLVGARDRDRQRLAGLDAIAQEAVDDLERGAAIRRAGRRGLRGSRARASPDPAAGRRTAGSAPRLPASRRPSGAAAFSGRTLSIRVVTSRTQCRPPCRNGRRSCSRQTSSIDHEDSAVAQASRRASPRPR